MSLILSILSLVIAAFALGWNVYRDVVLKARCKVSISLVDLIEPGIGDRGSFVDISGINFGPGPLQVEAIVAKQSCLWDRLLKKEKFFFIIPPYPNGINRETLPKKIAEGDMLVSYTL